MSPEKDILNNAIRKIMFLTDEDVVNSPELSLYKNPSFKKIILTVLEKRKMEVDLKPLSSFL